MKFKDRTFKNEPVNLDNNTYTGCTFNHCEVIYSGGGLPNLTNNSFNECSWIFDGAAARTMQFMTALHNSGGGFLQLIDATIDNIRGKKAAGIATH